ncbi:MAG: hypothetical protein B7Y47_04885 [Sphingomonas sp. 28-63-12]|nr:MAG: hypothetical protein B7Y47_04885 [Sphingomonas sp. 28-63-12]
MGQSSFQFVKFARIEIAQQGLPDLRLPDDLLRPVLQRSFCRRNQGGSISFRNDWEERKHPRANDHLEVAHS